MNKRKLIGGLALLTLLSGCNSNSNNSNRNFGTRISGKPLGVGMAMASDSSSASLSIRMETKKVIHTYAKSNAKSSSGITVKNYPEIYSLIQSEIAKGDSGYLELFGFYDGDAFIIENILAKDYTVNF